MQHVLACALSLLALSFAADAGAQAAPSTLDKVRATGAITVA